MVKGTNFFRRPRKKSTATTIEKEKKRTATAV
jgi:hypothetical protein